VLALSQQLEAATLAFNSLQLASETRLTELKRQLATCETTRQQHSTELGEL
jgi:hypothetical protein